MNDDNKLKGVFGCGLLMGLADAVPGVSGGTIALILGIYDKLLNFLSVCVSFFKEGFPKESRANFLAALNFLIPLALGMFLSYYLVTKVLVGSDSSPGLLMEKETGPYIYSFFFGLVLISIREPWKFVTNPSMKNYFLVLTTKHSVVKIMLAIEDAFCRVVRETLAGSMIPFSYIFPKVSSKAS